MNRTICALVAATIFVVGCSEDPPRVRVSNLRPTVADVQLKPPSGSTVNINDVGPNSTTGYIEVPTSQYEVDVNIESVSASATTFFTASGDESYTIAVLSTDPPTVRVDRP
jgi:hypothetical protein